MDSRLERELEEVLQIAANVMDEDRAPTEEERERFRALQADIARQTPTWRSRLADQVDRFAAALESMGI